MIQKVITLGILYFVQGLPYGFQDKFIPMYMRSSGLSHTKLSLMKLLLLPWLCKAAFAPVIDLFFCTKWFSLLCSVCCLSVISLSGVLLSPENFVFVSIWLFMLNLFSAIQDIAVDGLALQILRKQEIGHGNTAQVLGYKLGALSGGGVLFWIHLYFGWVGLCLSLFLLYVSSIIAFLPLYEKSEKRTRCTWHRKLSISEVDQVSLMYEMPMCEIQREKQESCLLNSEVRRRHPITEQETSAKIEEEEEEAPEHIYQIFVTIFYTKGTVPLVAFLLLYKLGERGALSTFPLFLIDQGITTKQLGLWSGVVGQSASILGSVCGGWLLAQKWSVLYLLHYTCIVRCIPVFLQWILINIWLFTSSVILHQILFFFSVLTIIGLEFFAGMATTTIFSLMMSCSLRAPTAVQGTHYSVLSSVEVAGKLVFSAMIGALIDWLGLSSVYLVLISFSGATVLAIPFLL